MATLSINNLAQAIYESSIEKSGSELDDLMKNTIRFLSEKHLLGKAPQLLQVLEKIIDNKEGITRATIESSSKLDKKTLDEISSVLKKRYQAKEIILTENIDKSLLGGIKIMIGDESIDLTLKNKLRKLENYLITH